MLSRVGSGGMPPKNFRSSEIGFDAIQEVKSRLDLFLFQ